jgi:hypothetical protein
MQAIEEALLANRKTKEANAPAINQTFIWRTKSL